MAPKASAPIEPSVRADGQTSCARALDAAIEAAASALAGRETPGDGLLLLCAMQEALPRLALQDPTLEPVDKIVWANLWLWAKEHGAGAAFPSYETLMQRANVRSRATAARALAILRLTRWVTLCRRVRAPDGQFRGNVYALHDEPLALTDTCALDPDYMAFIEESAQRHHHPRVRRLAQALQASLREAIAAGEEVTAASTAAQAERRAEALATLASGQGGWFAFRPQALERLVRGWLARMRQGGETAPAAPRAACAEGGEAQAGGDAVHQPGDRVQNLNAVELDLATPRASESRVQNLNAVQSRAAQGVQNLNAAVLCSSSDLNKTTTTTAARSVPSRPEGSRNDARSLLPSEGSTTPGDPLIYPRALSASERRLAAAHLEGLSAELRQGVLDELAERLEARTARAPPIRNPIGWVQWACRELGAGHMILTSLGVRHRERREQGQSVPRLRSPRVSPATREAALAAMRASLGRPITAVPG